VKMHNYQLIDTHAHLFFEDYYKKNISDIIERAQQNKIVAIINVGTDIATSKKAIKLSQTREFIYATCGVHPNDCEDFNKNTLVQLNQLLTFEKICAIGEIGLDFYWNKTQKSLQYKAFETQLELSSKYNLPVIIHSRKAIDDTIAILKNFNVKGVMHCFSGKLKHIEWFVEQGYYISFTGSITYNEKNKNVSAVPLSNLLLETDSPFMTPKPVKGKPNEPAFLVYILEYLAKIKKLPPEQIAKKTTENAIKLFNLKINKKGSEKI